MHALGDEVALAQGEAAAHGGAGARCPLGVERVDVEGEVDGGVGADVGECHFHDLADAVSVGAGLLAGGSLSKVLRTKVEGGGGGERGGGGIGLLVDIVHAECLDAVLPQEHLLRPVHVAEANVDQLLQANLHVILDPSKHALVIILGQARQERHRHPVDVARIRHLRRINIRMRIHPDERHLAPQPLADSLGRASNRANGNAVVPAEGEHAAPRDGLRVDLVAEGAGDGGHGARLLHVAVVGVGGGGGDHVSVGVHFAVVVDVVAQVLVELGEEAVLDELGGAGVNACFGLQSY